MSSAPSPAAIAPPFPPVRLGARAWVTVVLIGLIGQLAWTVENMYLNVFVYDTITDNPHVIATLVAASAIAATLATMLVGVASDRARTRRPFIAVGYILWGLATASFGLVQPADDALDSAQAVGLAIVAIVALDCIMSFFGSGANDAAFSAWVTDSTVPANRGRVDGVLAIMPLLGMLIVFGALDGLTKEGQWGLFFAIVGGAIVIVGVIAWFLVRDVPGAVAPAGGYFTSLIFGLRPSTIASNPRLYVTLVALAVFGISTQVFLPYLIIYIQRFLNIDGYAIILASVLILASIASVLGGRLIDRIGKVRAILPMVGIMICGMLAMFFVRDMLGVILAGTVMMAGMMLTGAAISATVRDLTPKDRAGMVQGLRMIAGILVPMLVGPFVGAAVIVGANETFDDLGVTKQVPTPWIFVASAVVAALVILPVLWLRRHPVASGDAS